MECQKFIDNFLSAFADRELSEEDSRVATAHLATCLGFCRGLLCEELYLKVALRKRLQTIPLPSKVREQIIRALTEDSSKDQ